jgi:hypothetical protein
MQNDNNQQSSENVRPGDEIISGAGNEDQLDGFKDNASAQQSRVEATEFGTEPSTGDEHLEAAKPTAISGSEEESNDSTGDKNGDVNDLGGMTNLSLDQLIQEGDNNDTNIL